MKNKRLFLVVVCLILVASLLCGCPSGNVKMSTTDTKPDIQDSLGNVDTDIEDDDKNPDVLSGG